MHYRCCISLLLISNNRNQILILNYAYITSLYSRLQRTSHICKCSGNADNIYVKLGTERNGERICVVGVIWALQNGKTQVFFRLLPFWWISFDDRRYFLTYFFGLFDLVIQLFVAIMLNMSSFSFTPANIDKFVRVQIKSTFSEIKSLPSPCCQCTWSISRKSFTKLIL